MLKRERSAASFCPRSKCFSFDLRVLPFATPPAPSFPPQPTLIPLFFCLLFSIHLGLCTRLANTFLILSLPRPVTPLSFHLVTHSMRCTSSILTPITFFAGLRIGSVVPGLDRSSRSIRRLCSTDTSLGLWVFSPPSICT